jgi:DegV family protein with EDD domain
VMPVALVTDSTAYLPRELVEQHGIQLVSLYVNWEDRSEREVDMPDFNAFYDRLRSADRLPTTSQPSIGDFLDVYSPLVDQGYDIVSIHISGGISGTVESARQAKERLAEQTGSDRVTVIDSERAAGGLGLLALAGARAAETGGDREAVVDRIETARANLKMWFAIDTLEYLRRGGRIAGAQAWLGSALKIKPILTVESEITPVERVRTSRRAFERMVELLRTCQRDGADAWMVQHIQAPDEADKLAERGHEIFGCRPLVVSEIGPVIGTHVGPGLLGAGGIPSAFV